MLESKNLAHRKPVALKGDLDMRFNQFPSQHIWATALKMAALLCFAALTFGCAPEESAVRDDFGNSVRAMIAAQTYQPGDETPSLDGGKAVKTMEEYRKDVPQPQKTTEGNIEINIGG